MEKELYRKLMVGDYLLEKETGEIVTVVTVGGVSGLQFRRKGSSIVYDACEAKSGLARMPLTGEVLKKIGCGQVTRNVWTYPHREKIISVTPVKGNIQWNVEILYSCTNMNITYLDELQHIATMYGQGDITYND